MAGVPYLKEYEVLIVLGLLSLGAAAYMTLQFLYYRDGLKSDPKVAMIFQAIAEVQLVAVVRVVSPVVVVVLGVGAHAVRTGVD